MTPKEKLKKTLDELNKAYSILVTETNGLDTYEPSFYEPIEELQKAKRRLSNALTSLEMVYDELP